MKTQQQLKFIGILAFGLLFRLLPFRPPNVEPILASQMPLARQFGGRAGFLFGALSILLYDILTGTVGPWTLITASAYGMLGAFAAFYFNGGKWIKGGKENAGGMRRQYVYFAIAGTLFYDAATGLTVGPLFFNQPFLAAVLGQIPFTLMHLLGNVGFALTLSPLVDAVLRHTAATRVSLKRLSLCVDVTRIVSRLASFVVTRFAYHLPTRLAEAIGEAQVRASLPFNDCRYQNTRHAAE